MLPYAWRVTLHALSAISWTSQYWQLYLMLQCRNCLRFAPRLETQVDQSGIETGMKIWGSEHWDGASPIGTQKIVPTLYFSSRRRIAPESRSTVRAQQPDELWSVDWHFSPWEMVYTMVELGTVTQGKAKSFQRTSVLNIHEL